MTNATADMLTTSNITNATADTLTSGGAASCSQILLCVITSKPYLNPPLVPHRMLTGRIPVVSLLAHNLRQGKMDSEDHVIFQIEQLTMKNLSLISRQITVIVSQSAGNS